MFIDASALVSILTVESDAEPLERRIFLSRTRPMTSPIATFETALAVSRKMKMSFAAAGDGLARYLEATDVEIVPITAEIGRLALDARSRYGKGTGSPARLNIGDCFAYACAKSHGVTLLYKGDDFVHTDLA